MSTIRGGYMGQILHVDLTEKRIWQDDSHMELVEDYVGGSGLGARLLYDRVGPEVDPLDPANLLMFLTGPLTATPAITSSRYAVVARSPQTGLLGEADSGGAWGYYLKAAGYDGILITGASEKPVYLLVTDEKVAIMDASAVWGKDTFETTELLTSIHGKVAVACIGQGGENLVAFAGIMNEGRDARAAGRTGLGAVMGSKKLKAVVAGGSRRPVIFDERSMKESVKRLAPVIVSKNKARKLHGTAGGVVTAAKLADMAVKNWRIGDWVSEAEKISGQLLTEKYLVGRYYCKGCVIGCGRKVKIDEGPYKGLESAGPEYESIAGLGADVLVTDLESVIFATELCNRYGLDVISTASSIAFAMEAVEKGVKFDDINPRWGHPEDVIEMIHLIAGKKGTGALLARGTREAARILGGDAPLWAVQAKGLEMAYHDPRAMSSLALAYATSPRGGCHRGNTHSIERFAIPDLGFDTPFDRHSSEGKAEAVCKIQDYSALYNSLKLCHFLMNSVKVSDIVDWYNYVTGLEISFNEFMLKGERIFNLQRLYNLKCGATQADDTIPARILEPFQEGSAKGFVPPLKEMLAEYYDYRKWDKDGVPTGQKLSELGLAKFGYQVVGH